jgi:hypothetical protein
MRPVRKLLGGLAPAVAAFVAAITAGTAIAWQYNPNVVGSGPGAPAGFVPFVGPVDRAVCQGPNDRPEAGMQGRTHSLADLASGRANLGFSCNLEQIGREGNGAIWQMAWYEDCAYYNLGAATFPQTAGRQSVPSYTLGDTTVGGQSINGGGAGGVAVVDVSDPTNPKRTMTLMTPAMIDPWESLKVNHKRGLLAGVALSVEGPGVFDVYDLKDPLAGTPGEKIATGCAHPVLNSSLPVNLVGHEGEWAPDGNTYYGSGFLSPTLSPIAVPLAPAAPIPLGELQIQSHGLSFSDDGNSMYLAQSGGGLSDAGRLYGTTTAGFNHSGTGTSKGGNGLVIYDVSQIQSRTPPLLPRQKGWVAWNDGSTAQMTIPVTIKGKPYIIFIDEGGSGMARIIDIQDETNPYIVSYLRNEINMPAAYTNADGNAAQARAADLHNGFNYQGHYCGVPRRDDPEVVACSYFWQGVRVFDIRDPHHPKEIAYFTPGGGGTTAKQSYTSSKIRFLKRKNRAELWFTSQNQGLIIAKFSSAWPFGTTDIVAGGISDLVKGVGNTFTLNLGQQPNGNTVVRLTPASGMAVSPATLTFTRANYEIPQTVTVSASPNGFDPLGSSSGIVTAKLISEGGLPPGAQDDTGVAYDLARDPHYMDNGGLERAVEFTIKSDDVPFTFVPRENVALNTFITTEPKTLSTRYTGAIPISVSGGQYSVNGGPFTTVPGTIRAGNTLALRHVSANVINSASTTTVTVGSYSTDFRSVTSALDRVPDAFDFGTVSGVAPSTLVQSGSRTLTGFNTGTPIAAGPGVTYSIDGAPFTNVTGTLQAGQTLQVQQTSSATHLAYTKGYVKVGGVYGYFTTRTQ